MDKNTVIDVLRTRMDIHKSQLQQEQTSFEIMVDTQLSSSTFENNAISALLSMKSHKDAIKEIEYALSILEHVTDDVQVEYSGNSILYKSGTDTDATNTVDPMVKAIVEAYLISKDHAACIAVNWPTPAECNNCDRRETCERLMKSVTKHPRLTALNVMINR